MAAEIRTEVRYAIRQGPYESNPPLPHTVTMYAPSCLIKIACLNTNSAEYCSGRRPIVRSVLSQNVMGSRTIELPCAGYRLLLRVVQGGSKMTGTDLFVNKPHCAAAVRP